MTGRAALELDTLTIRIPIRLQRRGGRKLIMAPEGSAILTPKPRRDETLIKALVCAHRWRRRSESGQVKSIADLAEQEDVTDAYVCRLLPLTCLAPNIVEAILEGRQPKGAWSSEFATQSARESNQQRRVLLEKLLSLRALADDSAQRPGAGRGERQSISASLQNIARGRPAQDRTPRSL